MLYKNTKLKVRSPDGDAHYFEFVADLRQRNTLAPCLFIICLDNMFRTIDKMKENGFMLANERSSRYTAQTISDADYADDIALLANTYTQAETQINAQRSSWLHRPPCQREQGRIHVL